MKKIITLFFATFLLLNIVNAQNTASKFYESGLQKAKNKDYVAAIEDYTKAIGMFSGYSQAYCARGLAKYEMQNYLNAIEDFTSALILSPNDPMIYFYRANAYGQFESYLNFALLDYDKAISLKPGDYDIYYNRSFTKYNLGDYSGSILDCKKAIDLFKKNKFKSEMFSNLMDEANNMILSFIYLQLADSERCNKDYFNALNDFNESINLNNKNDYAYSQRGFTKWALKDYTASILDYNKAIEINNKDDGSYSRRGISKINLSDIRGAILDFEQAIRLNPKNEIAFYWLGICKLETNKNEGCYYLSKAGELGYSDAYNYIRKYCN